MSFPRKLTWCPSSPGLLAPSVACSGVATSVRALSVAPQQGHSPCLLAMSALSRLRRAGPSLPSIPHRTAGQNGAAATPVSRAAPWSQTPRKYPVRHGRYRGHSPGTSALPLGGRRGTLWGRLGCCEEAADTAGAETGPPTGGTPPARRRPLPSAARDTRPAPPRRCRLTGGRPGRARRLAAARGTVGPPAANRRRRERWGAARLRRRDWPPAAE